MRSLRIVGIPDPVEFANSLIKGSCTAPVPVTIEVETKSGNQEIMVSITAMRAIDSSIPIAGAFTFEGFLLTQECMRHQVTNKVEGVCYQVKSGYGGDIRAVYAGCDLVADNLVTA